MSDTGNTNKNIGSTHTTTRTTVTTSSGAGAGIADNLGGCLSKAWPFLLLFFLLMLLLFLFKGFKGCNSGDATTVDTHNKVENTTSVTADTHSDSSSDTDFSSDEYSTDGSDSTSSGDGSDSYTYTEDESSSSSSGYTETSASAISSTSSSRSSRSSRSKFSKEAYSRGSTVIHDITEYLKSDKPLPKKFVLGTVGYDHNSPMINTDASAEVNQLAILLTQYYPFAKFKIHGHIDKKENDAITGKYQCSQQSTLSSTRANCLYCNFYKRGVGQWRMELEGHGSSDPMVSYASAKNRRVEIEILSRD